MNLDRQSTIINKQDTSEVLAHYGEWMATGMGWISPHEQAERARYLEELAGKKPKKTPRW